jgi:hypothetical protein
MAQKSALYFASGAREFWTCDEAGKMRFFNNDSEKDCSGIVPNFPKKID